MPTIQFATQAYQSRSIPLAAQQCVNLFVESAPPDAKSQVVLFGTPGIKTFSTPGNGPIRGARLMGGILYVISGNSLYSVDSAGAETTIGDVSRLGGTGPISMSNNRTQLIMVDGTVTFQDTYFILTKSTEGYVYSVSGGLVQITDTDFGTGNAEQFFLSAVNDGTAYSATDVTTAEAEADDLVAVLSDHREVWLFGERSIEVWYNSGATFPFDRISGSFIERGCAAKFSAVSNFDNTVVWLGEDLVVYRAEGYRPLRISTHAIEKEIRSYSTVSDAIAFQYTDEGHKFYVLTFPTEAATWVYDASTKLWHQRQSRDSGSESLGRWRVNTYVRAYGKHLVGDAFDNNLGELDFDTFAEYGNNLVGLAAAPTIHYDRRKVFMRRFELDVESGVGLTSGQGTDPQIMLDWSDDGGFSFGPLQPWRGAGKIGEYKTRLRWPRMGSFRERVLRVQVSDPVKRAVIAAHAELRIGTH